MIDQTKLSPRFSALYLAKIYGQDAIDAATTPTQEYMLALRNARVKHLAGFAASCAAKYIEIRDHN